MSCPFKHVWATSPAQDDKQASSKNDLASESIAAPVSDVKPNAARNTEPNQDISAQPSAGVCPFGHGTRSTPATTDTAPAPASASAPSAPATCPLGFGSSSGPKFSNLHCIICKSFLYDCIVTNCGHRYCRHCISRFRDCPSCGADITSTTADTETQALVEGFLTAHAGDKSIWQLEGTAPTASTSSTEQLNEVGGGKATLLLQIGLRALSGGNPASGAYRLSQCMDELGAQLESLTKKEGKESAAVHAVLSQMGAVAGCLADCARGRGDVEEALRQYEKSVGLLKEASQSGDQADADGAAQMLSVTLNKIGELHHMQGNIPKALELYKEALELRKTRWHKLNSDFKGKAIGDSIIAGNTKEDNKDSDTSDSSRSLVLLEAVLDVGVSEVKVADALRAVGQEEESAQHVAAAVKVMGESWVEDAARAAPMQQQRKLEALRGHLMMLCSQE